MEGRAEGYAECSSRSRLGGKQARREAEACAGKQRLCRRRKTDHLAMKGNIFAERERTLSR